VKGKVYLVGAGPGDPELLTVKALRLLQTADVVLYDDLVSPDILHLIPAAARLHNVGKRAGTKKISQD
jgi:uroporphyrin-III C-methyltransferase